MGPNGCRWPCAGFGRGCPENALLDSRNCSCRDTIRIRIRIGVRIDVNHVDARGLVAVECMPCAGCLWVQSHVLLNFCCGQETVGQQGPLLGSSARSHAQIGEEVCGRGGAPPIAMEPEGLLAVRSWGHDLVPSVHEAVHRAWAAQLIHESPVWNGLPASCSEVGMRDCP